MTETADVVIIGGGIVGSSIAYHLTEAGCARVVVLERESQQGLCSTGKSAGGVRAQFSTPINVQMSLYSIDFFNHFEEMTGDDASYKPHGYLFIATTEPHLDYLKANRKRQQGLGLTNVELLSREDVLEIIPQLSGEDVLGATFCPTDGFVDPYIIMRGFMTCARNRGAKIHLDTEVIGIDLEGDRVKGVTTSRGRISTGVVVNAAGPWAALVARLAGIEIPVSPLRRQIVNTEAFDLLPARLPMVVDMSSGFHFRPEGSGYMMAWPDPEENFSFNTGFDQEFIEKVLVRAVKRIPCFAEAEVNPRRCWAGLYEMTPDHHAIIGPAPGVEGLYLANGFSGHGVMHSPATGRIISDLIMSKETRLLDATPLGAERFAEGRLLHETAVL